MVDAKTITTSQYCADVVGLEYIFKDNGDVVRAVGQYFIKPLQPFGGNESFKESNQAFIGMHRTKAELGKKKGGSAPVSTKLKITLLSLITHYPL
jgi:hypothetical protein